MANLAIIVVGVVSCWLLVIGSAVVGTSAGATLDTSSCLGLDTSARLVCLPRLRPLVEGEDSPFFPTPWQASHYF
jgi:hypothetical protein